ncbi:MAG: RHS repeat-associated core domain-containing protein, partial [Bryobacteraceae bacterium]|jgi:RHS repeat-associated protein
VEIPSLAGSFRASLTEYNALGVKQKFTGKERDAETGLDYFGARYYSTAQGRFTTPDWSARPQAVPYADFANPQTLNLYTYVQNNPLSRTDPDGHCCWDELVSAYQYVKSVAYVKIEGGFGVGLSGRVGPFKGEVEAKRVAETKIAAPINTKKDVIEFAAKVEAGPVKLGPAATGESTLATGDQVIPGGTERDWHGEFLYDLGDKAKGSGWDLGLGLQIGVGLQGGIEVGVNGQKIVNDIQDVLTVPPPPNPPAPPPAPAASRPCSSGDSGCNR